MRIAVASSDGINVDQHFGKADRFLIYKFGVKELTMIEERTVQPFSDEVAGHAFNSERFAKVKEVLTDCEQVFIVKIGERPVQEFVKMGIEPVVYAGPIAGISS